MDSGEKTSRRQKIEDRIQSYCQTVEDASVRMGFPAPQTRNITQYMDMSHEEIDQLNIETLDAILIEISAHIYCLQDEYNKKALIADKCHREIMKLVATKVNDYDAFKFEDKLYLAMIDNDVTKDLMEIRDEARAFLIFWTNSVQRLADFVKRLDSLRYKRSG